jgi:hypothetical protein
VEGVLEGSPGEEESGLIFLPSDQYWSCSSAGCFLFSSFLFSSFLFLTYTLAFSTLVPSCTNSASRYLNDLTHIHPYFSFVLASCLRSLLLRLSLHNLIDAHASSSSLRALNPSKLESNRGRACVYHREARRDEEEPKRLVTK